MSSANPTTQDMVDMLAQAEGLSDAIPEHASDFSYVPPLKGSQMGFYESKSRYCLAHGERYSGKTWAGGHKIVKHCWEHWNALAIVVVGVRRQATSGGVWHKIITEVLPAWSEGQPGFECKDPKMDGATKDLFVWVRNKFGGWSQIQLVSIPHGANLADRVRGIEASMIYVDELTTVDGPQFYSALIQQVGRRPHIPPEDQQYVATTNPDGPSHWVHERFFEFPKKEDGTWDDRYSTIHIPISDNPSDAAQSYYQNVLEATRDDPVEYARLIEGKWVDRPSGEAIFSRYFVPEIHVRGDLKTGEILLPKTGLPITVGYDLGDSNHAIVFLQERATKDKVIKVVFDEIVYTDSDIPYDMLVPELVQRMHYWCEACDYAFSFRHISDRSAFDRFRATTGSYDYRQVEEISRSVLAQRKEQYHYLTRPVHLEECPKPAGSVASRIKMLAHQLQQEEIYFSALCEKTIDAMKFLESEKGNAFKPRRSHHLHPYDALTYALFFDAMGGAVIPTASEGMTPQLIQKSA